jgi:hypothetical protein
MGAMAKAKAMASGKPLFSTQPLKNGCVTVRHGYT